MYTVVAVGSQQVGQERTWVRLCKPARARFQGLKEALPIYEVGRTPRAGGWAAGRCIYVVPVGVCGGDDASAARTARTVL